MSQSQNLATTHATSAPEPMEVLMAVTNPTESTATPDVLASVTRPRLRSVRDQHTVPATARYAAELTDGALALRLEAITRLGVGSAPRRLSSIAAFTTRQPQARKLTVVPATDKQAAGQPDGAQPPLPTSNPQPSQVAAPGESGRQGGVGVPGARVWGGRLAQAVAEVLAGDRPISQLVRYTDDEVFMELNRRVRLLGLNTTAMTRGAKEKSAVQSVRVFMPEPSIAEVAAHVRRGDRSRAIALRMEIRRNRWVCTALEIG
ncbi:Rv3235 family protein [Kribbella sp. NPDC000426]|uniref:Rv3235 family protein n=1 Tax=Kribbella sp. NPDC000426 TaxID=3154255 RepID=UPI00332E5C19